MSSKFYLSIIEDEKAAFHIKEDALKQGATNVTKTYSQKNLREGSTFLDYNIPWNRCAYLYKYAAVHTGITAKYFQQLMKNKDIMNNLNSQKSIRICCLGGGPGVDVVGMFKAMAVFPSLHKKIVHVTVLDISGGWRNSFKHVIAKLKHGRVAGVPSSFIDANVFKAELISVDLLKPLPDNVKKIIASTDVVSMVKFVSAVAGLPGCVDALKVIASMTKKGATVFFIDNFHDKVFEPLFKLTKECGLEPAVGPLQERYISSPQKPLKLKSTAYGCPPLNTTKITVMTWIKTSETPNSNIAESKQIAAKSNDDWDTESDSIDSCEQNVTNGAKVVTHLKTVNTAHFNCLDKFTQTDELSLLPSDLADLPDLLEALKDLLKAMDHFELCKRSKRCCGNIC